MTRWYAIPLIWLLAALSGCGVARGLLGSGQVLGPRQIQEMPYLVRPGDQLDITILGTTDLNRKALIRDDGFFTFPGVGDVSAENRSLKEIQGELEQKLRSRYAETGSTGQAIPGGQYELVPPDEVLQEPYRLQIGDPFHVDVWGHEELSKDVSVREDGTFSFPLIGDVQAAGRTLREVEQEVADRLDRDFVVNPEVTARLIEIPFTVLGPVTKPGSYTTEGSVDLLTVLSMAGGLTQQGLIQLEIIRRQGNQTKVIPVDLNQVLQGRQPNLTILPHDTVSVRPLTEFQVTVQLSGAKYTVIGEVGRPGSYLLEGPVDLLTAISQAGGISKFGSNVVEIARERGGRRWVIRADLNRVLRGADPNVTIQPRDTLYVRRRLI